MMTNKLATVVIGSAVTMREAMECIDRSGRGIALVLDDNQRLAGTVTDGDLRRAILAGLRLEQPVADVLAQRRTTLPRTAPVGTADDVLLQLMNETGLRHIPLIDEAGRVVDVAFLNDLVKEYEIPLRAVVMAGGYGTRLRPLTESMPKPMLPVGSKPLLELIVNQLREAGIKHVNVATHYRGEMITDHFKDGEEFGVEINYVREDQPLGTAGALGLLEESDQPLVVINGDILTRVDFRAMHNFHREHEAELTVGVRQYEFCVPYGVINTDGVVVTGISEKPVLRQFINAGIYLLDPSVCRLIPNGQRYDIPELIERLVADNRRVVSFPIREYWLDIGKADHYDQAQADVAAGRF